MIDDDAWFRRWSVWVLVIATLILVSLGYRLYQGYSPQPVECRCVCENAR